MLVAASNPCPCGYYGEGDRCTCTPTVRNAYLSKLSGPIMDRIDIQLWMHPVETQALIAGKKAEASDAVAARVRNFFIIHLFFCKMNMCYPFYIINITKILSNSSCGGGRLY
jgi:magnesium chelatase family protein